MHNQTVNEKLARGVAWTAKLAAATLIVAVAAFGAKHDKSRQDAFLRGDASESQIIRNVRHELVMLSNGRLTTCHSRWRATRSPCLGR